MPYFIKKVKDGFKVCKTEEPKQCFSKKPLTKTKAKKQKTAIILSELKGSSKLVGGLIPLFGRVGGKRLLKKKILPLFPKDYDTYIEPFFGAGSLYFLKKPSKKEIVNDLDSDIKTVLEGFKKYNYKEIEDKVRGKLTEDEFYKIRDSSPKTKKDKFFKTLILLTHSFLGQKTHPQLKGKRRNPDYKDYKNRLKDTIILNQPYEKVIKDYDSKNSFFYLDPPYEESTEKKIYKHGEIDYKKLQKILSKLKGKFLMSINKSEYIEDLFKKFNIREIETKYSGKDKTKGGQDRKIVELLISNYPLKNELKGSGSGKREELIKKAEKKVGKIPKRYVPKTLSIPDLKKQLKSIIEEIKRPKLKSFKSRPSPYTKKAIDYFGEKRSLKDISKKLKIPLTALKQIYKKGIGAYYSSGSRPNQTPESWALARVYAVLFGSPARKIDKKIVEKYSIPLLKPKKGRVKGSGISKMEGESDEDFKKRVDEYFKKANPEADKVKAKGIEVSKARREELAKRRLDKQAKKEADRVAIVKAQQQREIDEAIEKARANNPIAQVIEKIPIVGALAKEGARAYAKRKAFDVGKALPEVAIDTVGLLAPATKVGKIIKGVAKVAKKNIGKGKPTGIEKKLSKLGFSPRVYLKVARQKAKKYGLKPSKLQFSDKPSKKLQYDGVYFGSTPNNDFIIYSFKELEGKVPKGTAKKRRDSYRARATKIKGDWKKNKTSPNNLAINILW